MDWCVDWLIVVIIGLAFFLSTISYPTLLLIYAPLDVFLNLQMYPVAHTCFLSGAGTKLNSIAASSTREYNDTVSNPQHFQNEVILQPLHAESAQRRSSIVMLNVSRPGRID